MEALYILNEYFPNGLAILVSERISLSVVPDSLCPLDCIAHGISRQAYWCGCHFILQGTFPTQGLNLGLPILRADSVAISQRNPSALERILLLFT